MKDTNVVGGKVEKWNTYVHFPHLIFIILARAERYRYNA